MNPLKKDELQSGMMWRLRRRPRLAFERYTLPAFFLGILLWMFLGTPAHAQKKSQRVIRLDAITVEGRIQKPQAIYILQRSILNFAELERTESFLPKIVQSVEKDCF